MAWSDPGDFTSGQILTAAQMDSVREAMFFGQATFTNEAARDAAIPATGITLQEGMRAYLTAPTVPAAVGASSTQVPTGVTTIYNGTAWVCVTEVGAASIGATQAMTASQADLTVAGSLTSVTLVTGTTALVSIAARSNSVNFMTLNVKASTSAPSAHGNTTPYGPGGEYLIAARTFVMTGLTAGTNTFTRVGLANSPGGLFDQLSLVVKGIA